MGRKTISQLADASLLSGDTLVVVVVGTGSRHATVDVLRETPERPAITVSTPGQLNNLPTTAGSRQRSRIRFMQGATVTGLASGTPGRRIALYAVGGALVVANENTDSADLNRIVTGTGADATIGQGGMSYVEYDDASTRWRMVGGGGGSQLQLDEEGVSLGNFKEIDFVGPGVSAADQGGGKAQVTVPVGPSEVTTAVAAGVATAEGYADAGDASTLSAAETYTDGAVTTAQTAGNAYADAGDAAEAAARAAAISAEASARSAGDAATLTAAEAYTDSKFVGGVLPTTSQASQGLREISLVGGVMTAGSSTRKLVGSKPIDLSLLPTTLGGQTRKIRFVADVQKTGGATNVEVILYDLTHNADITGADLTSTSNNNAKVASAVLTEGTSSGNLRTDAETIYEVHLLMNGGALGVDQVTISGAALRITYE